MTFSFRCRVPPSSNLARSAFLAYGIFAGALFAYNLRWKHIGDVFGRAEPKRLPIVKVVADDNDDEDDGDEENSRGGNKQAATKSAKGKRPKKKSVVVVLLHGMWHDASWWDSDPLKLQAMLKSRGYTSYAIELLPGDRLLPGFSQKEIVEDLERTLCEEDDGGDESSPPVDYIFVGHSQGGLVAQSCLLNGSPRLTDRIKAAALVATFPLGLLPPAAKLMGQERNMYSHYGYAGICLTGKLMSESYLKRIFLLPATDPATGPAYLRRYAAKLLRATSDGLITTTHFLPPRSGVGVISATRPVLVLGAREDIIYPPQFFRDDFDARFPNCCTHKVVPDQAHCFMDPPTPVGEESSDRRSTTMPVVLADWLDEICS